MTNYTKFRLVYLITLGFALVLLTGPCWAESWTRAIKVTEVDITYEVVYSYQELNQVRRSVGHERPQRMSSLTGFAVLRRNTKTGAYSCTIYTLPEPSHALLKHEERHCRGWVH